MDLLPNEEEQQIIDSVRAFFAAEFPLERLHPNAKICGGDARSKWLAAGELGLFTLGLSEQQGGSGYTLVEEILLFREAGRYLVSLCLLGQVLGTRVARLAGLDATACIRGTEKIALLAPLGTAQIGAEVSGDFHSFDGEDAEWFVVWNANSAALIPARRVAERRAVGSIDSSVSLARVRFHQAIAHAVCPASTESIERRAALYLAAQLVGISEAARDMAVEYAKVRRQFDQPIGAFQAIKHKCADMAVRSEAAWAQTAFAALSCQACERDATEQVSASVLLATAAAHENAAANVQIHGGIGYTAECDAHHFVKRARILERLLGSLPMHRRAVLGQTFPECRE